MNLDELYAQSFIIRIWLEETTEEAEQATWRGHITHVPSRKRHYFENLDEIKRFIAPYLESMNIDI